MNLEEAIQLMKDHESQRVWSELTSLRSTIAAVGIGLTLGLKEVADAIRDTAKG